MILHDMNQSWWPPAGYEFQSIRPFGSYLEVMYQQKVYKTGTLTHAHIQTNVVMIYLNDQGREVSRTTEQYQVPQRTPEPVRAPISRWFRFRNGWLLALQGLQEMITCLKK